jgi:hypothetical protein
VPPPRPSMPHGVCLHAPPPPPGPTFCRSGSTCTASARMVLLVMCSRPYRQARRDARWVAPGREEGAKGSAQCATMPVCTQCVERPHSQEHHLEGYPLHHRRVSRCTRPQQWCTWYRAPRQPATHTPGHSPAHGGPRTSTRSGPSPRTATYSSTTRGSMASRPPGRGHSPGKAALGTRGKSSSR